MHMRVRPYAWAPISYTVNRPTLSTCENWVGGGGDGVCRADMKKEWLYARTGMVSWPPITSAGLCLPGVASFFAISPG